jgi:hypothetical protein
MTKTFRPFLRLALLDEPPPEVEVALEAPPDVVVALLAPVEAVVLAPPAEVDEPPDEELLFEEPHAASVAAAITAAPTAPSLERPDGRLGSKRQALCCMNPLLY